MAALNSKRRVFVAAGALAFATAAVGALHMPFARPLLMRLGGCPLAGARMTPVEMENGRHMALADAPVAAIAPARPALGFTLDTTTLADVHAWAARTHADCNDPHPGLVKCAGVAPTALGLDPSQGIVEALSLAFDLQGRLVNETTYRSHLAPAAAARAAPGIVASLATKLGPAGAHAGTFEAAQLSKGTAESVSTVSYRFADYVADVSSMNIGSSGTILREHYMSARD
jgi:hypothetical protein